MNGVCPRFAPSTVLIGETQKIYLFALEQIIASLPGFRLVGSFTSFEGLISRAATAKPDLVLLDNRLLESEPDRVKWVLSAHPDARIIVEVEEEEITFCLGVLLNGAMGVIPRHVCPEVLKDCLHHIAEGTHWTDHRVEEWIIRDWKRRAAKSSTSLQSTTRPVFSPRETQVAALLIKLRRNKEIAVEAGVSDQAIRNILHRMFKKAGVSNKDQLRNYCIERGLLTLPSHSHHSVPTTSPNTAESVGSGTSVWLPTDLQAQTGPLPSV